MSVTRPELETMGRDELIDFILKLQRRVDDHEARLEAMSRWKDTTNKRLERVLDENERLQAENELLKDHLSDIEAKAEQAMTLASRGHNPESRSKTEVAKHLSRNELVRRATKDVPAKDRKLTIADVQKRAEPEHELAWEIVNRSWKQLREEWPQFRETKKDGVKALTISPRDIPKGLARAVEIDLERNDLVKQFVGDKQVGDQNA